jgi:GTP-binding protein
MKIKDVELAKTVFDRMETILDDRAKIVFIGRSNVGKSSLINALLNRKKIARTSSKPGKTVSINYYLVNREFYFVDLPGYGFARISKKDHQRVRGLMSYFFEHMDRVKLVCLLIDARRGFQNSDIEILEKIMNKNCKILTVLTKRDKLSTSQLKNQSHNLQQRFDLRAIPFSIKSIRDKENMLEYIEKALSGKEDN